MILQTEPTELSYLSDFGTNSIRKQSSKSCFIYDNICTVFEDVHGYS